MRKKKKKTKPTTIEENGFFRVHEIQRQDDGLWACTQVETDNIEKQNKASGSSISFTALYQNTRIKIQVSGFITETLSL